MLKVNQLLRSYVTLEGPGAAGGMQFLLNEQRGDELRQA